MTTNKAQSQIFLMAFQSLPAETQKEVFQTLKEQFDDTTDFWDTLTVQEKKDIQAGLADIDSGKTTPHHEVMANAKKD